ncbi:MAG TPA: hypothetical protein VIM59_05160 [Cellvibrio sp.]
MKKTDNTEMNLDFLKNYVLEDEIYLQLDKLQALTALQTLMNSAEETPYSRQHLQCYSLIMEEHLHKLRALLNQLFD